MEDGKEIVILSLTLIGRTSIETENGKGRTRASGIFETKRKFYYRRRRPEGHQRGGKGIHTIPHMPLV